MTRLRRVSGAEAWRPWSATPASRPETPRTEQALHAQMPQEAPEIEELNQEPRENRPTRRRRYYPTRMAVGPYRLATLRRHRGFVILDDRTGAVAYTEAHTVTGRPVPALEPDARQALRIAADLD